jgi:hypothetical protein
MTETINVLAIVFLSLLSLSLAVYLAWFVLCWRKINKEMKQIDERQKEFDKKWNSWGKRKDGRD